MSQEKMNENEFICSVCKKDFNSYSGLKSHKKTHSDEKPFKCSHCEYTSRWRSALHHHQNKHTDERPFSCAKCKYTAKSKRALLAHEKFHEKNPLASGKTFRCSKCDMVFNSLVEISRHSKIHLGPTVEKSFQCTKCERSFRSNSGLSIHSKIHVLARSLKCPSCYFVTTEQYALLRHKRTAHGESSIVTDSVDLPKELIKCQPCNGSFYSEEELIGHECFIKSIVKIPRVTYGGRVKPTPIKDEVLEEQGNSILPNIADSEDLISDSKSNLNGSSTFIKNEFQERFIFKQEPPDIEG